MATRETPEVRRAQILRAAMAVCAEKGYHATRIDDIAERSGLSKGALYHHFPEGKDAVFLALLESMIDDFGALLRGGPPDERPVDRLRRLAEALVDMTDSAYASAPGLVDFYVLSLRNREFRERFVRHYRALLDDCAALVRRAIADGTVASHLDPDDTARALFMSLDGLGLIHVVLDEPRERAVSALRALVDLLFHSIVLRKDVR